MDENNPLPPVDASLEPKPKKEKKKKKHRTEEEKEERRKKKKTKKNAISPEPEKIETSTELQPIEVTVEQDEKQIVEQANDEPTGKGRH